MRRIGVLGGTFDPVHFGHLRSAVEVRAAFGLDQVRLVPCRVSPHRDAPMAPGDDRLAMLHAATAGAADLPVDRRELDRDGPSFTVDTIASLAREHPAATLYLIVGSDAFAAFDRWDRWQRILQHAHVVVTRRPGAALVIPPLLADCVRDREALDAAGESGCVFIQPVTQLDISATDIRALAAVRGDLRYLVPAAVREHIERTGIYHRSTATRHADGSTG